MSSPLDGRAIVITRPAHQAGPIVALLRAQGATPILFPTIAIEPRIDREPARSVVRRLQTFDAAIFISANAAEQGLACVAAHGRWPADLLAIAVGPGTAAALRERGVQHVVTPAARFDSEGIVDLPELASPAGRSYVIFRGEGGREWLVETLRQRGARVELAEVYARHLPKTDPADLLARWQRGAVHAVVVASSEALTNLMTMLGAAGTALLPRTPTVVTHPRIAASARAAGLTAVLQSSPGDVAIIDCLRSFFAKVPPVSSEDEQS